MDKEEYKEVVLERSGQRDLKFKGVKLASATDRENNSSRWTNCSVYKTAKGNYVYGEDYISLWTGDHDAHTAERFESLEALFARLVDVEASDMVKELAKQVGFDMTEHID